MIHFRLYVASMLLILAMCASAFSEPTAKTDDALAKKHIAAGIGCKECHTSGVPAKKAASKSDFPRLATKETCLKCHGSYKDIAAATTSYQKPFNPHYSHYSELNCYTCHRVHQTSEMFCTSCHLDMKVPNGWKAAKVPADE